MALVRLPHTPLPYVHLFALAASALAVGAFVEPAFAEPPECLSFNPADWPSPARPYFMLVVDTSGSMIACTTPPTNHPIECNSGSPQYALNSCGLNPSRMNDAKCALRKTVQAFSGEVNFGLATYNGTLSCSPGACIEACAPFTGGTCNLEDYSNCTMSQQNNGCGLNPQCGTGAGPLPPNYAEGVWQNGGNIVVPLLQDPVWLPPPPPPNNTTELLKWFDGDCTDSKEIWASLATPLAGSLQSATQYLRAGWTPWSATNYCPPLSYTFPTPLNALDRPCRSINVILLTDGDESCSGNPVNVAADLWNNGVTIGGVNWKVPVHVINFAGGSISLTDQIAAAGGTVASVLATNEVTLAQALANIIGGANKPEVCDNIDNNCNGCTDEGYKHYCDTNQTCCPWSTVAQRTACLNNYKASIPSMPPDGNLTLLPCTSPAQQQDPALWLCYNPKESCDNIDNNCQDGTDEGVNKCGNPPHCPTTEICNGDDDDCDGLTDEPPACPNCGPPTPEVCDGCDNDCDGIADNGAPSQPCGFSPPANCLGTQLCKPAQPVPMPGGCIAGGGYQPCSNNPQAEICDGIDNNCNGIIDDGVPATPCPPPGAGPGTVYGPPSQCVMGSLPCGGTCQGGVGPSSEVCDGIDNDCDGIVDDNPFGVGQPCGLSTPPCTPGLTACVNGTIICQGGTGPQPEVCDGVDNDCDTLADENPLADAPAPGQTGCWTLPGNCCTFDGLSWCPPPGATCNGNGSLVPPCGAGLLACVSGSWTCQGSSPPSPEICDGLDNNCNGVIDDGIAPTPCIGTNPPGLDYGPNSQCKMGTQICNGPCMGFVGPSAEICDGIDNDCDGVVDDNVTGVGGPCGLNIPPCMPGTTVCINGAITCQGGTQPQPEVCDGIDNDCNGTIDNGPLADAPPAGQNGCWTLPGNCCTFDGISWCPPPGATCNGNGSLGLPCNKGQIVCMSGGWTCTNPVYPSPEVCDALDNDCDGNVDEPDIPGGNLPGEGAPCGTDVGECQPGIIDCTNGVLDCVGDIGPVAEVCDNKDNNCNGIIDDGIPYGGPCPPTYDMTAYPGDRNHPPCKPGILKCIAGVDVCEGGIGPSPEVCDGLDNDCDTQIDEAGPAPDGADGTPNPFPPPMANIGDPCGIDVGLCQAGMYACLNGLFTCLGQTPPQPEQCDCNDNDCNGVDDNENPPPLPTICGPTKDCVETANGCQCAEKCGVGEWVCPPGQVCMPVNDSETNMPLGDYCVTDFCPGGCASKTGPMQGGLPVCAPAGTMLPNCVKVPECECRGQNGCQNPCYGKTCGAGQVCAEFGPNKGQCVANNCYNVPCPGCDKVCNNSSCVDNPCEPNPCMPDEVCKPNGTFTDHTCVPSCANVMCPSGEVCVDGVCVQTCIPPCGPPTVCDNMFPNPSCVPGDICTTNGCADGKCCDPINGCGNCPCEGVVCPACQVCQNSQCIIDPNGCGSGGSTGSGVTTTGSGSTVTSTGSGGPGGGGIGGASPEDDGTWGLPTGGGGCRCQLGERSQPAGLFLGALAFALTLIRRKRSRGETEVAR